MLLSQASFIKIVGSPSAFPVRVVLSLLLRAPTTGVLSAGLTLHHALHWYWLVRRLIHLRWLLLLSRILLCLLSESVLVSLLALCHLHVLHGLRVDSLLNLWDIRVRWLIEHSEHPAISLVLHLRVAGYLCVGIISSLLGLSLVHHCGILLHNGRSALRRRHQMTISACRALGSELRGLLGKSS